MLQGSSSYFAAKSTAKWLVDVNNTPDLYEIIHITYICNTLIIHNMY